MVSLPNTIMNNTIFSTSQYQEKDHDIETNENASKSFLGVSVL